MKKILSFLLLATMLIGCLAPCAFAVEGPALVAESVEKLQGADKNVSVELTIENNPGIYSMSLVVYYDKTQLALGDTENAFAGSIFGAEDSSFGTEVAGTNSKIKNYVPSELRGSVKGFTIDLMGVYDDEAEDTAVVYGDGLVANLPLTILAEEFGGYDYTVVVAEAYDENGEELALEGAVGTVTYAADPYIGIYEEFTAFFTPEEATIVAGTETVDVDLRLDNNPGLWSVRVYIVYPEALTLNNGSDAANVDNNTGIFLSSSDLITGIPDLELTDTRQVQGFKELMEADPSIVREGYRSTTLYFERQDSYDEVYTDSGILCSLHFTVDPTIEPGTELDITLYYNEADFLFADTDETTGEPIFISYWPDVIDSVITVADCMHENTAPEHKDVTCTEDGYDRTVCVDCGAVVEETIIESQGHTTLQQSGTVIVQPTCTTPGSTTRYCDVCGEIASYEETPAYGHGDGEIVVTTPATCTTAGEQTVYCDLCEEPIRTEEIPALNHPEESREATGAKDPTCTEAGNTGKVVCGLCGETVVDGEEIPATGHVNTTLTGAVDATCTEEGYTGDEICDVCGETAVEGEVIPATGHVNTTVVGAVDATCTEDGATGDEICDACAAIVTPSEVIPATGHVNTTLTGAVDATCTEAGYTGDEICDACDATVVEGTVIDALGHDDGVLANDKAPTCTEEGYTGDKVCGVCGTVLEAGTAIAATGHTPADERTGVIEVTCTVYGYTGDIKCTVCGEVVEYGNVIPSLDHPETTLNGAADATCTEEGYTGDEICDICGATVVAGEAIDKLPHEYVDGFCSVCGEPEARNAWVEDENGWFYVDANGIKVTNKWMKDSKGWCYLGDDGYMVTAKWVKDSKGWCYVGDNGYMVTNKWVKDSKGWCYVGADGYCVTNKWMKDSKGWCYLGADGRMVVNKWVKDSKGWCYLGADGYMVTNKWVKDSFGWCYVGGDGYMLTNRWVKDGSGWCYVDGSGYCVTGTKVINGVTYTFDSNGRLVG